MDVMVPGGQLGLHEEKHVCVANSPRGPRCSVETVHGHGLKVQGSTESVIKQQLKLQMETPPPPPNPPSYFSHSSYQITILGIKSCTALKWVTCFMSYLKNMSIV